MQLCLLKLYTNVHSSIIQNNKKVKTIVISINLNKQIVVSPYNEILLGNKK
jgi:hypothetical protein